MSSRRTRDPEKRQPIVMIPDTVQGAIILSAIDFFLSFIIIGGIGVVLACFPYLNRFGKVSDQDLKAGH